MRSQSLRSPGFQEGGQATVINLSALTGLELKNDYGATHQRSIEETGVPAGRTVVREGGKV